MTFTERELREDLHKVRIRKYLYLGGGLGILVLGVALFVLFITRRDIPALVLAAIGVFWSIMLFYHYLKTRDLEALIRNRSEGPGNKVESAADTDEAAEVGPEKAEYHAASRERGWGCSR